MQQKTKKVIQYITDEFNLKHPGWVFFLKRTFKEKRFFNQQNTNRLFIKLEVRKNNVWGIFQKKYIYLLLSLQ